MKIWLLLMCCLCNAVSAQPYIKRFWKPIIFREEKEESFDRTKLIPIEEGQYNYGKGFPDAPKTVETIISSGNVTANNASFVQQELSADNIIKYLRENEHHTNVEKKEKTNIDSVYVTPVRKINLQ